MFEVTQIIDEGGNTNYPFYWTNTTHQDGNVDNRYQKAVYVAFGEALGFMEVPPNSGNYVLMDVHGAGAQRSDPKFGDPDNYPHGFGPQGDVIRIYNYVRLVRNASVTGVKQSKVNVPKQFQLTQNFPNPFNPTTNIGFTISDFGFVSLKVYNSLGEEVTELINKVMPAGTYNVKFDGKNLASGVYFYRIKTGNFIQTKKMLLIK